MLIVNDSGFERMVLRDQIRLLGYDVKAADEISSLNMLKQFHPNIVIANLTMGDISGDELIKHVKSMDPNIRCFLSSCSKIDWSRVDSNLVDGVIETPVANSTLEIILNSPGIAPKASLAACVDDETVTNSQVKESLLTPVSRPNICPSCQKQLEKTNNDFAFCPFCGTHL